VYYIKYRGCTVWKSMWKTDASLASASSARMVPSPRVSHEDALGAYIKKTGDVNLRQMSPAEQAGH
jgi:hypothetical protein